MRNFHAANSSFWNSSENSKSGSFLSLQQSSEMNQFLKENNDKTESRNSQIKTSSRDFDLEGNMPSNTF